MHDNGGDMIRRQNVTHCTFKCCVIFVSYLWERFDRKICPGDQVLLNISKGMIISIRQ